MSELNTESPIQHNPTSDPVEAIYRSGVLEQLPSPAFVIDESLLLKNVKILKDIKTKTNCDILLALKAFSTYSAFPVIKPYLDGITASGLYEARLGYEEFGKQVHVYSPGFQEKDMADILSYADTIIFNSPSQWQRFKSTVLNHPKPIHCGLRLNPQVSMVETEIYNPCSPCSRLGIPIDQFDESLMDGISGFLIHTLCDGTAEQLEKTLKSVEEKFEPYLHRVQWIDFGGGHSMTKPNYNRDLLIRLISDFQNKYNVKVILEPGEAVVYRAGYLVASVIDIIKNNMDLAILDVSATCHMPDTLEMPYRAEITGAALPGKKPHTYRLGAPTCLSGDIIGDYSFDVPLQIGQKLIFTDMAQYTIVKTTQFNGMPLPDIVRITARGEVVVDKVFGYGGFKERV